jgi:hypothetical protein
VSERVRTGQHVSERVRMCQDRSEQVRRGQNRSGCVRTGQDVSEEVSMCQNRSGCVRTGQFLSGSCLVGNSILLWPLIAPNFLTYGNIRKSILGGFSVNWLNGINCIWITMAKFRLL